MKKIFTLIVAAVAALSVNAQTTVVSYEGTLPADGSVVLLGSSAQGTFNLDGTTHNVILFKNGWKSSAAGNGNGVSIKGDFKEGDVLAVTGIINKADKRAAIQLCEPADPDGTPTVLAKTEDVPNVADGATDFGTVTVTIPADYKELILVRDGGTTLNVSKIVVTRGGATGINGINAADEAAATKAVKSIKNGRLVIEKNGKQFDAAGSLLK